MTPAQEKLAALLEAHVPHDAAEAGHRDHVLAFVRREPACFDRRTLPGHITGSAFIVDAVRGRLLLHHHKKLDRWLQMGGHDNGECDAALTALREAREESGLSRLTLVPEILDVDVHTIPARKDEPAHAHLDVRFLVLADGDETPALLEEESLALGWFALDEAVARMGEEGAARVVAKIRARLTAPG